MQVRNPRNGKFDYQLVVDSPSSIQEKETRLRTNQKAWESAGLDHRIKVLLSLATQLEEKKKSIIEQLSIDTGRKKISAIEFDGVLGVIKGRCYSAPNLIPNPEPRPSLTNPTVEIRQQNVPYEVVGVISPWNFPLLLALIDTIPALLAGCTVMLKPSEVTPRFIDPLEKIVSTIPELSGVLQFVRGGKEAGQTLIDSVDAICFTGSVQTGKIIAAHAASRFIPAFLELGGKDPAIVLEDADLDITSDAIMRSAAGATGQACQSLERIYVNEKIHDELVEMLIIKSNATSFNNDYSKGGTLGPLIFEKQADKINAQIHQAKAKGAAIKSGGKVEEINGGLWMMPTVITNVDHSMDVMTEETFGPVIPVMKFSTTEEAIALANESEFGLSASVFSKDIDKAVAVASMVEAGGISINDGSLTNKVFDAMKNSFKNSGLGGSRMGAQGLTRFFRQKALMIQKDAPQSIHSQDEEV